MAFTKQTNEQLTEQREIRSKHKLTYQLLGGLFLVVVGVWLGSQFFGGDGGYGTNLYTELLSIAVTVFLLDRLARHREEERETKEQKKRYMFELSSRDNSTAIRALDWIRANGLLKDGSLESASLEGANLRKADLEYGRLANSRLTRATLDEADCHRTDFSGSWMESADLIGAFLATSDLSGVRMTDADLKGAILSNANLAGADLMGANLEGAVLGVYVIGDAFDWTVTYPQARFDEHTILPDGCMWTPDVDLDQYTDRNHPDFWRSSDTDSPAYIGRKA